MFNSFPREVGSSRKIVKSKEEMIDWINASNGYKDCYTSVYKFNQLQQSGKSRTRADYYSAQVDKVFFDFDIEEDNPERDDAYSSRESGLEALRDFHRDCKKSNLKHSMFISGSGFHGYIFAGYHVLEYKKQALQNAHMHFINKLDLKIDRKIIGDLARITRIPNTFNLKREKFCVPLTSDEVMNMEPDELFKLADSPRKDINPIIEGKKLFLENFDYNRVKSVYRGSKNEINDIVDDEIEIEGMPYDINAFNPPESIRYILNKEGKLDYRDRFILIMFMRDNGLSENDCVKMMREILCDAKFYHCTQEECGNLKHGQISYLYSRDELFFPTEKTIRDKYGYPISGEVEKDEKLYGVRS